MAASIRSQQEELARRVRPAYVTDMETFAHTDWLSFLNDPAILSLNRNRDCALQAISSAIALRDRLWEQGYGKITLRRKFLDRTLEWIHESLFRDRDFMLAACDMNVLPPSPLTSDPEFALELVQRNADIFRFMPQWRATKNIVRAAVEQNGLLLNFADPTMRSDKDIVTEAVRQNPTAMEWVDPHFLKDEDVWIAAARFSLKKSVVAAMERDLQTYNFVPQELKTDPDVFRPYWLLRIRDTASEFAKAPEQVQGDCVIVHAVLETFPRMFEHAKLPATLDRSVCLHAVSKCGSNLKHCPEHFREDKCIVVAAVLNDPSALKFAAGGLNQDLTCWQAAGLLADPEFLERDERMIYSIKFGFCETASPYSTEVACLNSKNSFLEKFYAYNPSKVCMESCDPVFTNFSHPCRGTTSTCQLKLEERNGRPRRTSCWRYNFRWQQQLCRRSNGFMIQVEELGGLGKGQMIESDMAAQEGLKVFRILQPTKKRGYSHKDAQLLSEAVESWYSNGCSDMSLVELPLPKEHMIKS